MGKVVSRACGWCAAVMSGRRDCGAGRWPPAQPTPTPAPVAGKIEWGIWVDPDGCQHWWADGGTEGYMVPRREPEDRQAGLPASRPAAWSKTPTPSSPPPAPTLTADGRGRAGRVLPARPTPSAYTISGHTDSRGSDGYNQGLSERRAAAVAKVARSVGAVVEREIGFGESQPVAIERHGRRAWQKNRRVEVIC